MRYASEQDGLSHPVTVEVISMMLMRVTRRARTVYVRSYTRRRFGRIEYVTAHFRSAPSSS